MLKFIYKIFVFFRSLLFTIIFIVDTLFLSFLMLISNILFVKKYISFIPKIWTKINIFLLKYICGIKYVVTGKENIPDGVCLIASKHQSTWETYFLFQYFKRYPVFVIKKELLKIPGIGPALKNVGCIAIDRSDGIHAMKKVEEQSKKIIEKTRRKIIIFPQGTRVPLVSDTEKYPYKSGFLGIAKVNNLDILPVALNSGKCWPKGSFLKKPGTIEIRFLPVIKYDEYKDLSKKETMKLVENAIENAQKELK